MCMRVNLLPVVLILGALISRPILITFGMEIQFAKKSKVFQ